MKPATVSSHIQLVLDWFRTWEIAINSRSFEEARELFDESVVGFGTRTAVAHGLEELEREQWRPTWPKIQRFRFNTADMKVLLYDEERTAAALGTWASLGVREDGTVFDRSGRVTVILHRQADGDRWKAIHTHFSETPGTTQLVLSPQQ